MPFKTGPQHKVRVALYVYGFFLAGIGAPFLSALGNGGLGICVGPLTPPPPFSSPPCIVLVPHAVAKYQ